MAAGSSRILAITRRGLARYRKQTRRRIERRRAKYFPITSSINDHSLCTRTSLPYRTNRSKKHAGFFAVPRSSLAQSSEIIPSIDQTMEWKCCWQTGLTRLLLQCCVLTKRAPCLCIVTFFVRWPLKVHIWINSTEDSYEYEEHRYAFSLICSFRYYLLIEIAVWLKWYEYLKNRCQICEILQTLANVNTSGKKHSRSFRCGAKISLYRQKSFGIKCVSSSYI